MLKIIKKDFNKIIKQFLYTSNVMLFFKKESQQGFKSQVITYLYNFSASNSNILFQKHLLNKIDILPICFFVMSLLGAIGRETLSYIKYSEALYNFSMCNSNTFFFKSFFFKFYSVQYSNIFFSIRYIIHVVVFCKVCYRADRQRNQKLH